MTYVVIRWDHQGSVLSYICFIFFLTIFLVKVEGTEIRVIISKSLYNYFTEVDFLCFAYICDVKLFLFLRNVHNI